MKICYLTCVISFTCYTISFNTFHGYEGVETEEQLQTLKVCGCETVQGYLLGKPMNADKLTITLKREKNGYGVNQRKQTSKGRGTTV
jgi:predicted signal transduction protein with EAL and GGDEF domain